MSTPADPELRPAFDALLALNGPQRIAVIRHFLGSASRAVRAGIPDDPRDYEPESEHVPPVRDGKFNRSTETHSILSIVRKVPGVGAHQSVEFDTRTPWAPVRVEFSGTAEPSEVYVAISDVFPTLSFFTERVPDPVSEGNQ